MSLPIGPGDGKAKVDPLLVSSTTLDQQQQQQQPGSSSPWRTLNANNSDSLLVQNNNKKKNKLDVAWFWWDDDDDHINPEESDEDMFTVPDVEAMSSITANTNAINNKKNPDDHHTTGFPGKRRRGRNPVDKEYRRLKRLLRNRVSAQQARERKKVYVNDLESRAGELENSNSKLEEKISTLINENTMLRKVLMNTRPKVDESIEQKQDQLSKS